MGQRGKQNPLSELGEVKTKGGGTEDGVYQGCGAKVYSTSDQKNHEGRGKKKSELGKNEQTSFRENRDRGDLKKGSCRLRDPRGSTRRKSAVRFEKRTTRETIRQQLGRSKTAKRLEGGNPCL